MNYPTAIKKTYKKQINYGNRGMDLENFINQTNEYYLEKDIAVIYKKPTPIQVVKYNYDNKNNNDYRYNKDRDNLNFQNAISYDKRKFMELFKLRVRQFHPIFSVFCLKYLIEILIEHL